MTTNDPSTTNIPADHRVDPPQRDDESDLRPPEEQPDPDVGVGPPADDRLIRRAQDDRLIAALLGGATYAEAAEAAGCSVSTLQRRLETVAFRERLDAERRDVFDRAAARLLASIPIAHDTLVGIAQDPDAPATARVNASRSIISAAREYLHDATIEARLTALEQALGHRGVP